MEKFKHIHFVEDNSQHFEKKSVYDCLNNKTKDRLAQVFYYKPWKKFAIIFNPESVFDESCLVDIAKFLKALKGG